MQSDAGGGASWIDSSSSSATGRKTRSLTCAGCCASPPSPPRARGSPSARHSWPRCSGRRGRAEVTVTRPDGAAPLVRAEFPGAGSRTLLFYDHYDVQPPDPLHAWTTPPFEPSIRDGKLYARGAADNKGDLTSRLWAVKALQATRGGLACRVKFIIEGEGEIGGVHFEHYVNGERG